MARILAFAALVLTVGIVVFREEDPAGASSRLPARPIENAVIETISHGQAVRINDHLEAGTFTVVEFAADW